MTLPHSSPALPPGMDPRLGRVIAIDTILPEASGDRFFTHCYGTFFAVPSLGGYDPLVGPEQLRFALGLDFPNVFTGAITPEVREKLDARAVRYWIVDPRSPQLPEIEALGGFRLLASEKDRLVFEDTRAQPLVDFAADPATRLALTYVGNSIFVPLPDGNAPSRLEISVGPTDGWWYRVDRGPWMKPDYHDNHLEVDLPASARLLEVSYFDSYFREGLGGVGGAVARAGGFAAGGAISVTSAGVRSITIWIAGLQPSFFESLTKFCLLGYRPNPYVVKPQPRHLPPTRLSLPVYWTGWLLFLFCVTLSRAQTADLPASVTLDLPLSANRALPTWLGQPQSPATTFATLNLPIIAPDATSSLLVTVYFQEKEGGFLRIIWTGTQGAQVLSDNFYENIGMANQRSLLISPPTLFGRRHAEFSMRRQQPGHPADQAGMAHEPEQPGFARGVRHAGDSVRWADPIGADLERPASARPTGGVDKPTRQCSSRRHAGANRRGGRIQRRSGRGARTPRGWRWMKRACRSGKHLIVWINEQRAGTITPEVPDLADGGFLPENGSTTYVGWRNGSYYVPVSFLKPGVNTLQFDGG